MKLSAHFDSKEFACKDGCGYDEPDKKLVDALEVLRSKAGDKPLIINSACRCQTHNKAVKGSPNSQHLKGKAADVRPPTGMTTAKFAEIAEQTGLFGGVGIYNTFVHVDVRKGKARWDYRK